MLEFILPSLCETNAGPVNKIKCSTDGFCNCSPVSCIPRYLAIQGLHPRHVQKPTFFMDHMQG